MKKIVIMHLACIGMILASCKDSSPAEKVLKGDHALQMLSPVSYFGFQGTDHNQITDSTTVIFCWKMRNSNRFIMSRLPYQRIRIQIDNQQKIPLVKFQWEYYKGQSKNPDPNTLVTQNVYYAVFMLKQSDWPVGKVINISGNRQ